MVFYFSGTGNSQLAALQIAEITADEVISINRCLKTHEDGVYQSKQPLVFVAPTYAWRMPRVVEQWIGRAQFQGSREAYFVLTCAGGTGNAAAYIKKLCAEKGLGFRGLARIIMPENYVAMYPTPSAPECQAMVERAKPHIAAVAQEIKAGKQLPAPPVSAADRLKSGPVNTLFYGLLVHDRGFSVSDGCVSCGKCAQRCPLNNIDLVEGRPMWRGCCTHCMACIGGCPTQAIQYKSKSQGQHRHYIMRDAGENGGRPL